MTPFWKEFFSLENAAAIAKELAPQQPARDEYLAALVVAGADLQTVTARMDAAWKQYQNAIGVWP